MKKLLVMAVIAVVTSAYAEIGQFMPRSTIQIAIEQAVVRAKAYTDKAVSNGVDKAETAAADAYQPKGEYVVPSDLYKLSQRLAVLEAAFKLMDNPADMVEVEDTISYNDPTKSVALTGSFTATNGAAVTAKKVAATGLSGDLTPVMTSAGSVVGLMVDTESLTLDNSTLAGTTQQSSNLMEVHGAEEMVVENVIFSGSTYNTIMTGQRTTGFLKKLVFKNCVFAEDCKHINIWFAGFQDDAVLEIKNCMFKTCEQFLCISDFHGTEARKLTVNIEDVEIDNYQKDGSVYEGIMMVDDRVCTTTDQLRTVNPFSKVTINLKNVTVGGVKLTQSNFGIGTGGDGQQLYYYSKNAGGVYPYNETNASLFPTVNFVE